MDCSNKVRVKIYDEFDPVTLFQCHTHTFCTQSRCPVNVLSTFGAHTDQLTLHYLRLRHGVTHKFEWNWYNVQFASHIWPLTLNWIYIFVQRLLCAHRYLHNSDSNEIQDFCLFSFTWLFKNTIKAHFVNRLKGNIDLRSKWERLNWLHRISPLLQTWWNQ